MKLQNPCGTAAAASHGFFSIRLDASNKNEVIFFRPSRLMAGSELRALCGFSV